LTASPVASEATGGIFHPGIVLGEGLRLPRVTGTDLF
jgi:hypothetical protein